MLKVGLTGGYATGKSFVAAQLERFGCHVIRADELGHAVLQPEGEAYKPALEMFGRGILDAQGAIDRKKLGALVFENPQLLDKLNSLIHPPVIRLEEQSLENFRDLDPHGIAVIEAAILIEVGRHLMFDRLIVTACSKETQIARGMKRDHITREEVLARLARQLPLEEKKRYAHYVVDTNGPKEETTRQVQRIFEELQQLAQPHG
jgi:dephospho-CoA kinase